MIPNFKWNTTTIIILIIIIVFLACLFLNSGIIEKFADGEELGCPDRLYFDGKKYYLFRMNLPIEDEKNPLIYQTYEDYLKNKPANCSKLEITQPYRKNFSNKKTLPILPFQWQCQREQALDFAKQSDCANKSYTIFTKEECDAYLDNPAKYYSNNAIERCTVKATIDDFPELVNNKTNLHVGFSEEGLVRVGADIGGNPYINLS
jgi:hypothetical protein